MSVTVKENYQWFKENLKELCKSYNKRYIVIKDKKVIGDYSAFFAAYDDMTARGEKEGTYIIQHCIEDLTKDMMVVHNHIIPASQEACA